MYTEDMIIVKVLVNSTKKNIPGISFAFLQPT